MSFQPVTKMLWPWEESLNRRRMQTLKSNKNNKNSFLGEAIYQMDTVFF